MAGPTHHTVVVHHWSPEWTAAEVLHDCFPHAAEQVGEEGDRVIAYNAECSLPVTLSVSEGRSALFRVSGVPEECPLCKRPFKPWEQHRIRNAAIANHLRVSATAESDETLVGPTPIDVVLDV